MTDKPLKIKFAPGVLEQLEEQLSPEDLQEFMDELKQLADSGELETRSTPVDMLQLQREDPELHQELQKKFESVVEEQPRPTLQ